MSSFVEDAKRLFGTSNLYEVLQLKDGKSSNYSQKQIKKAYLVQSLKVHPDRAGDDEKAMRTEQFQILSRAYAILIDDEKRKIYDETGIIGEDDVGDECDWETYCKRLFKKVTKTDIELFIQQYRESGEERMDLKAAYLKNLGDMDLIMTEVIGVTYEDEERLRDCIKEMIESGEVEAYPKFVKETAAKRKRRRLAAEKEAKEAEDALKEIEAKEGNPGLYAMIRARQQKRGGETFDAFCDSLAEKYGKAKPSKRSRKAK